MPPFDEAANVGPAAATLASDVPTFKSNALVDAMRFDVVRGTICEDDGELLFNAICASNDDGCCNGCCGGAGDGVCDFGMTVCDFGVVTAIAAATAAATA